MSSAGRRSRNGPSGCDDALHVYYPVLNQDLGCGHPASRHRVSGFRAVRLAWQLGTASCSADRTLRSARPGRPARREPGPRWRPGSAPAARVPRRRRLPGGRLSILKYAIAHHRTWSIPTPTGAGTSRRSRISPKCGKRCSGPTAAMSWTDWAACSRPVTGRSMPMAPPSDVRAVIIRSASTDPSGGRRTSLERAVRGLGTGIRHRGVRRRVLITTAVEGADAMSRYSALMVAATVITVIALARGRIGLSASSEQ